MKKSLCCVISFVLVMCMVLSSAMSVMANEEKSTDTDNIAVTQGNIDSEESKYVDEKELVEEEPTLIDETKSVDDLLEEFESDATIKLGYDDTKWQEDFTYTLDKNKCIIELKKLNDHSKEKITIPSTAKIDGVVYSVKFTSNCYRFFADCYKLTTLKIDKDVDTSDVTNMSSMFDNCRVLTSLDLSGFNTSNVTDMSWMFHNCWELTKLEISSFDTSNVKDMGSMFIDCSKLESLDVSNFNTGNVSKMNDMFNGCKKLKSLDLSGFNTSNVTSIYDPSATPRCGMFRGCSSLTSLDLSSFDTSKIGRMDFMFYGCSNLKKLNISSFNTANVYDMYNMFGECSSLTSLDLSNFDMSKVKYNGYLFDGCNKLNMIKTPLHLDINIELPYTFVSKDNQKYEFTCLPLHQSSSFTIIMKHNYNYKKPVFVWSKDHTTCTVKYPCTCRQGGFTKDHYETHECTVTSEVTTKPTCTKKGKTTYTATYGKSKDVQVVEDVPMVDHNIVTTTTPATPKADGKVVQSCSKCKSVIKSVNVYKPSSMKLSLSKATYTGEAIQPTVTVTNSKGKTINPKYYTVKYINNTSVGTATVKVVFKKLYKGILSKTFTVIPKKTLITAASSPKKGSMKVTWNKQATVTTGYEIQVSPVTNFKKNVKTVNVAKPAAKAKTITGLKKGKNYVRIRTYKIVNGTKYYSAWSKYGKAVTVK